MEALDCEVLIVGAGPTGLAAALALSAQGVRVAIIDEAPERHREARASAIHARTFELLTPFGVADRLAAYATPIERVRFFGSDGREVMRRDFRAIDSPYPPVQNVQQWRTEALLDDQLLLRGVHVARGTRFESLSQIDAGVEAVLTTPLGQRRARSAFLIAADGGHSCVRRALGLHMEGSDYPERWIAGELRVAEGNSAAESQILFEPDRVSLQFPLDHGRLFFATLKNDELPGQSRGYVAPEEVERVYREGFGRHAHLGADVRAIPWSSLFVMHQCTIPDYRHGRVFLAGDAAHLSSAAGGNGLNSGVGDAINLAWRLAAHLRLGASEAILDGYSLDRHEHFDVVNAASDATHRLIAAHDPSCFKVNAPRGLRAAFARIFSHAQDGPAPADRELGETSLISTRDPAFVDHVANPTAGAIRAGMRVPMLADCSIGCGAPRPWCALFDGFHWTLLLAIPSRDHIGVKHVEDIEAFVLPRLKGRVRTVVAAGDAFAWNAPRPTLSLIRPDGIVAYREDCAPGGIPDGARLSAWLDRFFPAADSIR
ncbi:MAG: Pentachlorophenol 4-monooxygenase [Planctomycetota bacterium]|jgi:2-polyprenyl-6-methoxyphenol hydroxylase-like FAD-dependent oxidoreductase